VPVLAAKSQDYAAGEQVASSSIVEIIGGIDAYVIAVEIGCWSWIHA
jgi:hypothetical protein